MAAPEWSGGVGGRVVLIGRVGRGVPSREREEHLVERGPAQTDVVLEETFAPILYAMPYDTLDEAIALHNASRHGSPDHEYYLKVKGRHDGKLAAISVARQFARRCYHILRNLDTDVVYAMPSSA